MADALHITNARLWTAAAATPQPGSIIIRNGRIEHIERNENIDQPRRNAPTSSEAGATLIDARGRVITPGLIDSHMHLLMGGRSLRQLDLSQARTRQQFEQAIAEHARARGGLGPDDWLIATGWSQENWPAAIMPDKSWLAAAGSRPTVCYRMDMHAAVVNEPVLRKIDFGSPALRAESKRAGSECQATGIVRNHHGQPTGLLLEAALWELVNRLIPEPDVATRRRDVLAAQRHCHSLGITAVGTMEYASDVREIYEPLRDDLTLRCRVTLLDRDWPLDLSFAKQFAGDDRLAVIGCKAFIDGTLGSRTARMLADYADDHGNRGALVELARDGRLHEWARLVSAAGLSPSMHAIGDEAVRLALDVLDDLQIGSPALRAGSNSTTESAPIRLPARRAGVPKPARIEHAQQIDPADIPRFAGRIASMQPLHKADDCRYVRRRLGDERISGTFAFRSLLNAGAILAFGSDWPVVTCDPIAGIRAAVTGLTFDDEVFAPEQNITVHEALRAYTADAAHALGMNDCGHLRNGGDADLVMWSHNPFEADWRRQPPRVVMTIVGGRIVWQSNYDRQASHASR